ncbi:DUF6817 domain-containing protein [Tahibacter amnicola]|uniref:DUF6817 domain-containing protein n=1 Tax=Tahibacter amnicola TaxID=2976241 RepID=A0ABY6BD59_9GAMM|nr:hypothetical protein [Tahibacter amnicola]UXI66265.1 hypothetical protein N4264_16080 [Tahibacter amnicola]
MTPLEQAALALLDQFDGANSAHSDRTVRDHVIGTRDLLFDWGLDEALRAAALCHNVYGTATFAGAATLAQRDTVRAAVGPAVERLVYLFCRVRHRSLFDATTPSAIRFRDVPAEALDGVDHRALLHLVLANTLDQFPSRWWVGRAVQTLQAPMWKRVERLLAEPARARWQDESRRHLRSTVAARVAVYAWRVLVRVGLARRPHD